MHLQPHLIQHHHYRVGAMLMIAANGFIAIDLKPHL